MNSFPSRCLLLFAVPLVVTIAGCAGASRTTLDDDQADALLHEVTAGYATTPMLTINGTLTASGVPTKIWFDAYVRAHDSVKTILTGPFGMPVGAMSATPQTFEFFSPQDNTVFEGTPDHDTFRKVMMVNVGYDELVALFRGELPSVPERGEYRTESSDDGLRYMVDKGGRTETFTIDPARKSVVRFVRMRISGADTVQELSIEYANFRMAGERMFPHSAVVNIDDAAQTLWISVDKVDTTIDTSKSFALDVPAGVERRHI